jgi:hypothetical protein
MFTGPGRFIASIGFSVGCLAVAVPAGATTPSKATPATSAASAAPSHLRPATAGVGSGAWAIGVPQGPEPGSVAGPEVVWNTVAPPGSQNPTSVRFVVSDGPFGTVPGSTGTIAFSLPALHDLAVGTYTVAASVTGNRLSVGAGGWSCDASSGEFQITQITFNNQNTVTSLAATFNASCGVFPIAGAIAYDIST